MLKTAVDGSIPIIALRTRDALNAGAVIHEITGRDPVIYDPQAKTVMKADSLLVAYWSEKLEDWHWHSIYEWMVKHDCSLIVINPGKLDPTMFDAGELPVPKSMLLKQLLSVTDDEGKAKELLAALGGVTIKEMVDLIRLTMARDHGLTPQGLVATRRTFFAGQPGLHLVDTVQVFYQPNEDLIGWLKLEKPYFLNGADPRLVPRGLAFDGPSGVGKTSAAKWLAEKLGVPLYRIDLGGTKDRWTGSSEHNMLANLQRLDHEAPCCLLLDEVEKVFGVDHNDGGTTSTMLSQLLWWLAEHRSRVLTLMTTNNASKLPTELYREGRIDKVIKFEGLGTEAATEFAEAVFKTFGVEPTDDLLDTVRDSYDGNVVSHARVTEDVYNWMKANQPAPQ